MARAGSLVIVAALALAGPALTPPAARAQFQIQIRNVAIGEPRKEVVGQPLFVTEREMTKALRDARDFIGRGEYEYAVRRLQDVLDRDEDLFYQPDRNDRSHYLSLKGEAQRLVASLPQEGRDEYEREYGHAARGMLGDARGMADVAVLEEVARRFFHTEAGYEATRRLATYHFDRGESLAAAMRLEQLRQAAAGRDEWEPMLSLKSAVAWGRSGMPEQALAVLVALKADTPGGRITLAGESVPLFAREDEALPWLAATLGRQPEFATLREERWTMFRGNAARNGVGSEASPLWREAWSLATLDDRDAPGGSEHVAEALEQLGGRYRDGGLLTLPAVHPLVIGETVVFRTIKDVRAVNLAAGTLVGETVRPDHPYQEFLRLKFEGSERGNAAGGPAPRETLLAQRAWRDLTGGTLSSDGRWVYAVEDLGFLGFPYLNARAPAHPLAPKDHNTLSAFSLAGDLKLEWEAGGPRDGGLPAAGAFFLGPPLPLGGELYCLVEGEGEIRLTVLDPQRRGAVAWEQRLVYPPDSLERAPRRRLAGLSPAYADGVMVCPTAAGAVVAVDLSRRILRWGYQYATNQPEVPQARRVAGRRQMLGPGAQFPDDEDAWLDSVPTVAGGRVVLTPCDSNDVHCLNLVDGTVRWKRPRGQGLYVGGVYEGKVVVVGRGQVEAWDLDDGSPAWPETLPVPPPSGRGIRTGGFYHLPLSTGEVATIDLKNGRMLARSPLPEGQIPGNLITAGGVMLSQTAGSLVALQARSEAQAEIEAALAADPSDAEALVRRAELALHAGREEEGLDDLRRVLSGGEAPRAAELVALTLLEGLRLDFGRYREHADEIEGLIEDPQLRGRFLRLHAEGLQRVGESVAAFENYVRLAALEAEELPLETVHESLAVRSDRWVRPRLAGLYADAAPEQKAAMDRLARAELERSLSQEGPDALRRFAQCFADLPVAAEARQALVARLDPAEDALELEFVLDALRESPQPEVAAQATARLAALLIERGRPEDAAGLLDALAGRWRDVVCLDGRTGDQLAREWSADQPAAPDAASPRWPDGPLTTTTHEGSGGIDRMYPLDLVGRSGPYFENWTVAIDARRQNVLAADGYGRERWKLPIVETGRSVYTTYGNMAQARGHLTALVLGNYFAVVDPLSRPGKPRVLWHQDLYEKTGLDGTNRGVNQNPVMERGVRKVLLTDGSGRPLGTLGPITRDALHYHVGTELTAADPLTGGVLWRRRNVPRGTQVFGDEEFLLLVAPESTQATVLRAADGEVAGTRPVPADDERVMAVGRLVVSWREREDGRVLGCQDPWTGETRWQREFPREAQVEPVKGDEVAVLDPAGRLTVLSAESGAVRVDAEVGPVEGLTYFHVRRTPDRYLLLTQGTPRNAEPNPDVQIQQVGFNTPFVSGTVYGFDRATGARLWGTDIGRFSVELNQSDALPVLLLTARILRFEQKGNVRSFNQNQYALLVLDTRNGAIVHRPPETRNSTAQFEAQGDPETGQIDIRFQQMKVTLRPADEPLEAPKVEAKAIERGGETH